MATVEDQPRSPQGASFTLTSTVGAPTAKVWKRVASIDGINHELMPLMRMTIPREHRDQLTVDTLPVGAPLGRARIYYLGFLPLDYDDLTVVELDPGTHFQEVSTMRSMRHWEHRRALRRVDETHTEVTDQITFEPRHQFMMPLLRRVIPAIFRHRHRRLAHHFH